MEFFWKKLKNKIFLKKNALVCIMVIMYEKNNSLKLESKKSVKFKKKIECLWLAWNDGNASTWTTNHTI